MKYINLFNDNNYCYCFCIDNNRIYKGPNAKRFTPDIKYFLSISLALFLTKVFDNIFENSERMIIIALILLAVCLPAIAAIPFYKQIIKKFEENLKEYHPAPMQLEDMISKGKKQFQIQLVIIAFMLVSTLFLFFVFYYHSNPIILLLSAVMCFISVLAIMWIKPITKYRFFKNEK